MTSRGGCPAGHKWLPPAPAPSRGLGPPQSSWTPRGSSPPCRAGTREVPSGFRGRPGHPGGGRGGEGSRPTTPGAGAEVGPGPTPLPARPPGPRRYRERPARRGLGRAGGTEGSGGGMGRGKAGGSRGRGTPRRDPSVPFWPGGRLFGGVNQAELLSLRGRAPPPPRKKRKLRRTDKRGLARSPHLRQGEQPFPVG